MTRLALATKWRKWVVQHTVFYVNYHSARRGLVNFPPVSPGGLGSKRFAPYLTALYTQSSDWEVYCICMFGSFSALGRLWAACAFSK